MPSAARKISAKALITDIRAGLDNPVLMRKYSLSAQQLKAAFNKLIERGALSKSELDTRSGKPLALVEHEKEPSSAIVNVKELTDAGKESGGRKLVRKAAGCIGVIDNYIQRILRILRNTDQPTLSYVWRVWLIAFIPSFVIGTITALAIAMLGYDDRLPDMSPMFFLIVGVIIAPWVETVFLGWILAILKRIIRNTLWVCLVSAVIWGVLHGLQSVGQGLTVTWVFFIMSLCFLEWEKKSRKMAIRVTALIHMCQNGVAFIVMLILVLVG